MKLVIFSEIRIVVSMDNIVERQWVRLKQASKLLQMSLTATRNRCIAGLIEYRVSKLPGKSKGVFLVSLESLLSHMEGRDL
jgi:hypothetical protein